MSGMCRKLKSERRTMVRQKLNLTPEERRIHNNELHQKQRQKRRKIAEREECIKIVWRVMDAFESLGWDKTDLVVGSDEKMVSAVVDKLIAEDSFKITLGPKTGIRTKEKEKDDQPLIQSLRQK